MAMNLSRTYTDTSAATGAVGTELTAEWFARLHPSVNAVENRFLLPVENGPRAFSLLGGTYIKLISGGHHYVFGVEDTVRVPDAQALLDTGTTFGAGMDYYIYLCNAAPAEGGDASLIVSKNSTYPLGYSAETSRKIGGFHTECKDVGEIAAHPLSGFKAGDILPASLWCLTHRPACSPEGMAYIEELDFWADIYLQSGTGLATVSAYGGTVTDSQYQSAHIEDLYKVGKVPLSDEEFSCAAEGSNLGTNISGSADPVTTGGHVDTGGRRMVSKYGLEDCCGAFWQWLQGCFYNATLTTWQPDGGKGQIYGCNGLLAGGFWVVATYCGPRARAAITARFSVYAYVGCRGRARSRMAR